MKRNDVGLESAGASLRDRNTPECLDVKDLDLHDLERVSGGVSSGHGGDVMHFAVIKIKAK